MPIDTRDFQTELQRLLLRLARLIQEMADGSRNPMPTCCAGPALAPQLRPIYLHVLQRAQRTAEQVRGLEEAEAAAYVQAQLVRLLRSSSDEQRRCSMSLSEALGHGASSLVR